MKKKIWFPVIALLLAAVVGLGICLSRYAIVEMHFYPKDTAVLDLRGQDISLSHYLKLTSRLPDTAVLWDVPFQEGVLTQDTRELTVSSLSIEEAGLLATQLPKLRTVDGNACTQLEGLRTLKQLRPDVQVLYRVPIGGTNFASTAVQLNLNSFTEGDLAQLSFLPNVKTVTVSGGDSGLLAQLQTYCQENGIDIRLSIGGRLIPADTTRLELAGLTDAEAALLPLLPELKRVHLTDPEAAAETLLQLRQTLSGATVTWEKSVLGLTFPQNARLIDLTDIVSRPDRMLPGELTPYQKSMNYAIQGDPEVLPSAVKLLESNPLPDKSALTAQLIDEVESAMAYFPDAEKVSLYGCYLDNEAMAAFRERHAGTYKVAWTVQCGKIATRTDATFFMPVKYHVYYLNDAEAANLRYCPDLIALDIGHMMVSDVSFVENMPNLTYLILAHTAVRNIEPLQTCKNLKFLELDHTACLDFTPLLGCTALEDLNIGMTWNDVTPLKKLTWLKNLWMIDRSRSAPELIEALPHTNIVYSGSATVDSGWRDLPNYYAMRDELLMFYMGW